MPALGTMYGKPAYNQRMSTITPKEGGGYMNPGFDQYDDGLAHAAVMPSFDGGDPWGQPPNNPQSPEEPPMGIFPGERPVTTLPSPVTGGGSPYEPSVGSNGSGVPDWITNLIGGGGGGSGGMTPQQAAYLAASMGMAGKQWGDAGKIEDRFNQIADDTDYLRDDREGYAGQLAGLMADPSSIEKNPAYQFRLSQGLNTLGPQQAAKGGGYGNAAKSMIDYAGNAASQEYDNQVKNLSNLAGFQFDQGRTAADLRTAGLTGRIASENAALGSAAYGLQNAFGSQPGGGGNNNGGGGGGGNNPAKGIVNGVLSGAGGQQLADAIGAGGKAAAGAISEAINQGIKFIKLPDGTTIDVEAAARSGGGTDGPGGYSPYPTGTRDDMTTGGGDLNTSGGEYQPGGNYGGGDPDMTGGEYQPEIPVDYPVFNPDEPFAFDFDSMGW